MKKHCWKRMKPFELIEGLQNNELNALPVYVDRFKKTKIRAYDKVFSNFVV